MYTILQRAFPARMMRMTAALILFSFSSSLMAALPERSDDGESSYFAPYKDSEAGVLYCECRGADGSAIMPSMSLSRGEKVRIAFDMAGHQSDRYVWRLRHLSYKWEDDEGLSENEYMDASTGEEQRLITGTWSNNTSLLYTHYAFSVPSSGVKILISGNYLVEVLREEDAGMEDVKPLCRFFFSVYDDAGARMETEVSGSTDIDTYTRSQQVSVRALVPSSRYPQMVDPAGELHLALTQNGRPDMLRYPSGDGMQITGATPGFSTFDWKHVKSMIFNGGREFYRFDANDVKSGAMAGVDRCTWISPLYHLELFPVKESKSYIGIKDENGEFVVRNSRATTGKSDTESEYVVAHFRLERNAKADSGKYYVGGAWNGYRRDENYLMKPLDGNDRELEAAVLLKQGYYSYTYIYVPDSGEDTQEDASENGMPQGGSDGFYETENRYDILLYARFRGERYDRLLCVGKVFSGAESRKGGGR